MADEKQWISTVQAAREFGLPVGTLLKARMDGRIPFRKLGDSPQARVQMNRADVEAFVRGTSFTSLADFYNRVTQK